MKTEAHEYRRSSWSRKKKYEILILMGKLQAGVV